VPPTPVDVKATVDEVAQPFALVIVHLSTVFPLEPTETITGVVGEDGLTIVTSGPLTFCQFPDSWGVTGALAAMKTVPVQIWGISAPAFATVDGSVSNTTSWNTCEPSAHRAVILNSYT
jgi:hypothetical protein